MRTLTPYISIYSMNDIHSCVTGIARITYMPVIGYIVIRIIVIRSVVPSKHLFI